MKESRHANFGAIQAIFLQLSWSQHKLAHSCQGRGQRSNGAINRNIHLFRSFCRGISNLVTPSLTVAELLQKGFRVNSPQYQLAPESTRTPLVNSHPRTLTNSHPDQHVRLPRRGPWQCWPVLVSGGQTRAWLKSHSPKLSASLHGRDLF